MAKIKRREIRIVDPSDKVWDIVTSHADDEKVSNGKQAHSMLNKYINQNKIKPIKKK